MPTTSHSAVPTARRLTAAQTQPGDLIAGHNAAGDYALLVIEATPTPEGQILLQITPTETATEISLTLTCDPDQRLVALPRHHGICADCGRLAPCPAELAERRLERLFDQPAPAQPINIGPPLLTSPPH
ncbi:Uncharacterised protein [Mycobacteroides abscessus subsp. abscessus]|nr:Uncharacterised protein [Mycobacteroides abscessus subsp. abscessus]